MNMHWDCPTCGTKVNFEKQMGDVFDLDGSSDFDPELGLWLHTIECDECESSWNVSISKVHIKNESSENNV